MSFDDQGDLFEWAARNDKTRSRADQILSAFIVWHRSNPGVWELFKRFTFEAINAGRKSYSARFIVGRIRWHVEITTKGDELKINDHHSPYYGRMFHAKYPQHDGFFRNRNLISRHKEAYAVDIQVFKDGPPMGEGDLMRQLADL